MTRRRVLLTSLCLLAVTGILAVTPGTPATELGRLFTTPDERLKIDAIRKGEAVVNLTPGDTTESAATDRLTLNGTLRGSNGRQRVWINGEGLSPTGARTQATMLYDGRVRLQWQADGTSAILKPGQTLDKLTGDVYEPYNVPRAGDVPALEKQ